MKITSTLSVIILLLLSGCGSSESDKPSAAGQSSQDSELTAFELEHGIGPITEEITISTDDLEKIEKGRQIFDSKCAACHQMNERFVGPALGDVSERRSDAYIMNMILNPSEMARKHPEGLKLLAEYMTPMPFQNVTEEDARAITAYLKNVAEQP
ncbi:MAG: c-type cytochrome [Cyclonatronaceae bacterium]